LSSQAGADPIFVQGDSIQVQIHERFYWRHPSPYFTLFFTFSATFFISQEDGACFYFSVRRILWFHGIGDVQGLSEENGVLKQ